MRVGGIVLCGGESRRMGRAKAVLPFGDEVMLARVLRLLGNVVEPLVVVAAVEQPLPLLPARVQVVRDCHPGRGPLEGLLAGLVALEQQVDAVYVSGCDVPLLVPAFVSRLIELLGSDQIAVPVEGPHFQPLSAVYRTSCIEPIRHLLDHDQLRPAFLFDRVATHTVPVDQLRDVDPELHSLMNLNHPEDYERALRLAGCNCRRTGL